MATPCRSVSNGLEEEKRRPELGFFVLLLRVLILIHLTPLQSQPVLAQQALPRLLKGIKCLELGFLVLLLRVLILIHLMSLQPQPSPAQQALARLMISIMCPLSVTVLHPLMGCMIQKQVQFMVVHRTVD
jgi:hypothetical protein